MITLTRKEAHHLLVALQELNRLSIGENAICLPAEIDDAMELLEARLSAPEPEPVAWKMKGVPAFATSRPNDTDSIKWDALYTAPPHREWQGLTEQEKRRRTHDRF